MGHLHGTDGTRADLEGLVAQWLPADVIQARMKELEGALLGPLMEEAEAILR